MVGWALVTGASGGLGEALARDLAIRGYDLVLVARSEDKLDALAEDLRGLHGRKIVTAAADLSQAGSAMALWDRMMGLGIDPVVLINNAAFGLGGPFVASDVERIGEMLRLDIVSLTELTLLFGRRMAEQGAGRILLVGSVGAYSPAPLMAAYAAAKAYVLSLGEALHVELAPKVGVTVLSPGIMDTGFGSASGLSISEGMRRTLLSPTIVARIGLDALFAGKSSVIAGRLNQFATAIGGLFSRQARARLSFRVFQTALQRAEG